MYWTLYKYIFKDLFRIFLLASGALSAIMSFGGLLRPLYEYGLDVAQVAQILSYSSPAMTAYSLPIAALFATTIVYGRLGADNEVIACRAAGISHLALAAPAALLGFVTAVAGIVLLCFVVPACTLRVEQIIYSNLAKLVASQIERTHQVRFPSGSQEITVFAETARVLDPDPNKPNNQAVQLIGPMIVQYEQSERGRPPAPETFNTAAEATAYITQDTEDDDLRLQVDLTNGTSFPRAYADNGKSKRRNMQISVQTTQFGPIELPSPVKENTKFMDIFRLKKLYANPEQSRRMKTLLREFDLRDQQETYLQQLADQLNSPEREVELKSSAGETYVLTRGDAPAEVRKDRLVLDGEAIPNGQPARFLQTRGTQANLDVRTQVVRMKAFPDPDNHKIQLEVEMTDCVVAVAGIESPHENFSRVLNVPMPQTIHDLTDRPVSEYVRGAQSKENAQRIWREFYKLTNSVISEVYARLSFAVSCFILVMVGCALGMMFRSGNFLSAFAVSVIPALISIALIVAGQHTAENVPWAIDIAKWSNPLSLGLALIWSGNVAVAAIAIVLLGRLQRQ